MCVTCTEQRLKSDDTAFKCKECHSFNHKLEYIIMQYGNIIKKDIFMEAYTNYIAPMKLQRELYHKLPRLSEVKLRFFKQMKIKSINALESIPEDYDAEELNTFIRNHLSQKPKKMKKVENNEDGENMAGQDDSLTKDIDPVTHDSDDPSTDTEDMIPDVESGDVNDSPHPVAIKHPHIWHCKQCVGYVCQDETCKYCGGSPKYEQCRRRDCAKCHANIYEYMELCIRCGEPTHPTTVPHDFNTWASSFLSLSSKVLTKTALDSIKDDHIKKAYTAVNLMASIKDPNTSPKRDIIIHKLELDINPMQKIIAESVRLDQEHARYIIIHRLRKTAILAIERILQASIDNQQTVSQTNQILFGFRSCLNNAITHVYDSLPSKGRYTFATLDRSWTWIPIINLVKKKRVRATAPSKNTDLGQEDMPGGSGGADGSGSGDTH